MKLVSTEAAVQEPRMRSRPLAATLILAGGLAALAIGIALSVSFGAADIRFAAVWEAILRYDADVTQHQIIQELRLPRVVGGAIIGASLAVAGAIMQGMTRNPLADSSLLGLHAGAGLAVALCFAFFPALPYMYVMLAPFLGAGAALTALFSALGEGISLYFNIGQDLAFWFAGGIAGIKRDQLEAVSPWIAAALIGAIALGRSITMLSLGEDIARGLGLRTGAVKAAGAAVVLVLAGAAVSVVGAVGFVGLLVRYAARRLVGVDYRWIISCSAVLGALLVVFADLAARMVDPPYETPTGAVIALLGVPFFLFLARKETKEL
ncbi:FecCD family ABC transporter permease [Paenibacillus methanolicus]|uniref:Iron complex transport system permease protein n=1 Tax=Paenibacillus methanolicus TaxID=582686 RepID=A0A5S5C6K7_9BACL|nr:iron ABC transporter permease [Paenibacillus methanolicus]TYP74112.1 iron complex transport system permease protein [Paenibacillus methanolicus]